MALGNGTWVPVEERSTRWFIFKHPYLCRVSNIQTMSIEYLQHFGMPSVGDKRHDTETANELISRMLPISEMVKLFNDGVNIRVVNYADTKDIYERITDHLNYWKQNLENGLNTRGAPIEDLILMDTFAVAVYDHAKHQFTTNVVESIIARRMSTTLRVNRDRILTKRVELPPALLNSDGNLETVVPDERYPARVSMASAFAATKASITGSPKWK